MRDAWTCTVCGGGLISQEVLAGYHQACRTAGQMAQDEALNTALCAAVERGRNLSMHRTPAIEETPNT